MWQHLLKTAFLFPNINVLKLKQDISLSQLLVRIAGPAINISVSGEQSHQLDQLTVATRLSAQKSKPQSLF